MPGLSPTKPDRSRPIRSKLLRCVLAGSVLGAAPGVAAAQPAPEAWQLPMPTSDPLRIDFSIDPILRLSESAMPADENATGRP